MATLIDIKEVVSSTGLSRSLVYKLVKDGKFPGKVDFSDLKIKSARWNSDQVQAWINDRTFR